MPRFTPDLADASATIPEWENGVYQVMVHSPKGFIREGSKGIIAGIRLSVRMVGQFDSAGELDRSIEGKPSAPVTFWLHTDKTAGMNKRAFMAILGLTPNAEGEKQFNEEYANDYDWGIDGDVDSEVEIGDGFHLLDGRVVNVKMSIQEDGEYRNQDFSNWAPVED